MLTDIMKSYDIYQFPKISNHETVQNLKIFEIKNKFNNTIMKFLLEKV